MKAAAIRNHTIVTQAGMIWSDVWSKPQELMRVVLFIYQSLEILEYQLLMTKQCCLLGGLEVASELLSCWQGTV